MTNTQSEDVAEWSANNPSVVPTGETFTWFAGALAVTLGYGDHPVRVVGLTDGIEAPATSASQPLVEILTTADGRARNSTRFTYSAVGTRLRHFSHSATSLPDEERLDVVQRDEETGLVVTTTFVASPDVAAARVRTRVINTGSAPVVLEAVATFAIGAIVSDDDDTHDVLLHSGSGEQLAENRWSVKSLWSQEGLGDYNPEFSNQPGRGYVAANSASTWTTARSLPTGVLENPRSGRSIAWQIEHNGPWRWEVDNGRVGEDSLSLVVLGPTDLHHQWSERLEPGQEFETVPASFAVSSAGATGAIAELTGHRRWLRRFRTADAGSALVYNDFMNTLTGDPTTERLLPLIEAAGRAGAEYFCIDAGWYDDTDEGDWWPSVGEWAPAPRRFPDGGLERVVAAIRQAGMRPGIWVEPEVIGVLSPVVGRLPDDAFLQRHGVRVREHDRYFLDLRHAVAQRHLDETFDRLIGDFGIEFFKLDYNVMPGSGTDRDAFSTGAGLLAHNRAHLAWFAHLQARHPQVLFENCSSGAMRSDFGMLELFDFQSTSDQTDFRLYPAIAAGAPMQMLPEQSGNWAYVQPEMTDEEIVFTLVTGLSGRLYLSGFLSRMTPDQLAIVHEAVGLFKETRDEIARSTPEWPAGYAQWDAATMAVLLKAPDRNLLFVWHRSDDSVAPLDLRLASGLSASDLTQVFPRSFDEWTLSDLDDGRIRIVPATAGISARIYEITRH